MPIYAYKCESCGLAKDILQKISDPLLTQCPACGASTFKKQLTAAGFQLKGSGWYATDFKGGTAAASVAPATDASGAAPQSKPTDAPSTTSTTSTKTESAPASGGPVASGGCGASCACH